jgi:hypothetical protein
MTETKYALRPIAWSVSPLEEPLFSELATTITIVDEAGGEFLEVEQPGTGTRKIRIDPEEWPAIRDAINHAMECCKKETK